MFDFEELGDGEEAEDAAEALAAVAAAREREEAEAAAAAEPEPAPAGASGREQEDRSGREDPAAPAAAESADVEPLGGHEGARGEPADAAVVEEVPPPPSPPAAAEEPPAAPEPPPPPPPPRGAITGVAVGDHLVSIVRVQMRMGESLQSAQVGLLPADRRLEVLEVGKGRRIHVLEESGVDGWVSLAKENGDRLLERHTLTARERFMFQRLQEERRAELASPAPAATPSAPSKGQSGKKCDKCDGPHDTDSCPFFKKAREDHKDAWANYGQKGAKKMGADGGNFTLRGAKVIRQPGDGSCLFHSLSFGLSRGGSSSHYEAESLRRELAAYIEQHPDQEIGGDTIEEWVRWDANSSVSAYAAQMGRRGWGGGVEMAVCSLLKAVNVHVYEAAAGGNFKRISCFDAPGSSKTVHVLYQGRCHYDALVPAS